MLWTWSYDCDDINRDIFIVTSLFLGWFILFNKVSGYWSRFCKYSVFHIYFIFFFKGNTFKFISIVGYINANYSVCIISLRHSVNGDFCDHSSFLPWHQNLTTFVSWTCGWGVGGKGGGWP